MSLVVLNKSWSRRTLIRGPGKVVQSHPPGGVTPRISLNSCKTLSSTDNISKKPQLDEAGDQLTKTLGICSGEYEYSKQYRF